MLWAFNIDWDSHSKDQINRFLQFGPIWESRMTQGIEDISKAAQEHMKPLMHVRPQFTGSLENSLRFEVHGVGNGWQVDYYGNFYGNFVDEGSPFDILWADAKGLKAFPIDKRFGHPNGNGSPKFSTFIHGIGKGKTPYSSQLPTHFSENTAEWLAQGEAENLAMIRMEEFLNQVVIT